MIAVFQPQHPPNPSPRQCLHTDHGAVPFQRHHLGAELQILIGRLHYHARRAKLFKKKPNSHLRNRLVERYKLLDLRAEPIGALRTDNQRDARSGEDGVTIGTFGAKVDR